jgi:hypothetical protein
MELLVHEHETRSWWKVAEDVEVDIGWKAHCGGG